MFFLSLSVDAVRIALNPIEGPNRGSGSSKFSSAAQLNADKIKLTVASPESLRVKQGDLIVKGKFWSIGLQPAKILCSSSEVQQEVALLTATEQIPTAPTNTNAAEVQVQQARERVRLADAAIQDYLSKSPYTDLARQTLPLPTEEKQLAQLQFAKHQPKPS
ncbi:hypothetical protein [Acaryochloris sp. CCMEE 5410]|uniref:hypothetical protein n=1 Tax=Acaryochloris sp. CCMEE 5410 TaxID=310037 RepID=UPI0021D01546|nr:hypothetical protein [Acaryochloris sp. CCMEE 5410]